MNRLRLGRPLVMGIMISTAYNADPGFGIYVHWPFCAQKCPYCDFNSHVRMGGIDEARFEAAYLAELGETRALIGPRTVSSIFLGGGTPSLMQPGTVAAILDRIAALFDVAADAEITLEANPGSVEAGRFAGYRTAGVNRVSLGVQSLHDAQLQRLGRIHTVADAKAALAIAAGTFERVSFDLIYARPRQTPDEWRAELAEALALERGHLSLYQLTIEPDTPFAALHAAGRLVIPDDDMARTLYLITQELTEAAGLPAYEVSNHARAGQESRHNLLYWRYGEYAGIGPGAHGRIRIGGRRHATSAKRHPESWADAVARHGHGRSEMTALGDAEMADEALLMGLRLVEGLDLDWLARVGGRRPGGDVVAHLAGLGLIETMAGGRRMRAAGDGRLVLNALVAALSDGLEPVRPSEGAALPSA